MQGCKLRIGVNLLGALKQNGMKQLGITQCLGVYAHGIRFLNVLGIVTTLE